MLDVRALSVSFGGVRALDDVTMTVRDRETVGLIGPNGSGKTTLVNALTGMVEASGTVRIGGEALELGSPGPAYDAGIVRTYQTPRVFGGLSCLENVLLAMRPRPHNGLIGATFARARMKRSELERWERAHLLLERMDLGTRAEELAGELPYGRQRVLEFARALAADPQLILLDEPAAGLNHHETEELAELIRGVHRDGIAMLLIEHKIDFVSSLCDRLVVLELGQQIAEGPPGEVFSDPRVMDAYLGERHDA